MQGKLITSFVLTLLIAGPPALALGPAPVPDLIPGPAPVPGEHQTVVILLQFQDVKGVTPPEDVHRLLFDESSRSVRDYFLENSAGAAAFGGHVVPVWLTSEHPMATYGRGDGGVGSDPAFDLVYDSRPTCAMALEAARLADPHVDYSQFVNQDGRVKITVVHAGTPQDMGTTDLDVWSHKWSLCDEDFRFGPFTFDGVRLDTYMTVSEFSPMGTYAHEYGHLHLTLPDLYFHENPVRYWDLMATGSWSGYATADPLQAQTTHPRGANPSHLGAYMKASLGWLDVTPVDAADTPATFTLSPLSGPDGVRALRLDVEQDACRWSQKLVAPFTYEWASGDRYFLLEYRDPEAARYDGDHARAGVVAWFIDECAGNGAWWNANRVQGDPRVRVINVDDAAIPAGEAFSKLSPWSSRTPGSGDAWFAEVLEVGETATVRVGVSGADARLVSPPAEPSASTSRTQRALPDHMYSAATGTRVETPGPAVMTRDAPIRFMPEGATAWSVTVEGARTIVPACAGSTIVTCRLPADTEPGAYVIRVTVTDGETERRITRAVEVVG